VFTDPERVQGVVLVDAALGLKDQPDANGHGSLVARGFLAITPLRNAVVAMFLTNPDYTEKLLQKFVDNPAAATPALVSIYQQPLALAGSTRAIGDWLPVLLLPDHGSKSDQRVAYRALKVPARLIWGSKDRITPLAEGQDLAQLLTRSRLVTIDGVGHIPQIEDSPRFRQVLVEQLIDLRASGN
jgi:pimeloyl-ACP methyl ester carboxylesterase